MSAIQNRQLSASIDNKRRRGLMLKSKDREPKNDVVNEREN